MIAKVFVMLMLLSFVYNDLVGVVQLNRHGARAPSNFPEVSAKILHGSSNFQLTINGFKQLELLGQWVAERYMHYDYNLLSSAYNSEEMLFKASPEERTIFSGAAFIKGMFPKSNIFPIFTNNTQARVHNVPPMKNFKLRERQTQILLNIAHPKNDKLFHSQHCRHSAISSKSLKGSLEQKIFYNISLEEVIDAINEIRPQYPKLFKGKKEEDIYSFEFFRALTAFIIPIQFHTNDQLFNLSEDTISLIEKFQLQKIYGNRIIESESNKMINSALFDEISNALEIYVNKGKLKYVLFSGHDTNIVGILVNLLSKETLLNMLNNHRENFNFLQPGFASSFIMELHKFIDGDNTEKHFVRILYNNEILRSGFDSQLKYNEALDGIEYESLKAFLQSRIHTDYKNLICDNDVASESINEEEGQSPISIDLEKKLNEYHLTYLNVS